MKTLVIRERVGLESDVAQAWWSLQPQTMLALEDGRRCLMLYNGQPGGPVGPDVRDAVLRLLPRTEDDDELKLTGDVEFHVSSSAWFAHGHQDDPRYNRVILHVVYYLDSSIPTRRQDGSDVPTCSLLDLARAPQQASTWPCQCAPLTPSGMTSTLLYAGLRRFHAKSEALGRGLAETPPGHTWSHYDLSLIPALAEGLGYGRDRAIFRAAGMRLLGLSTPIPEPLGRTPGPAPLDAHRLRTLRILVTRWQVTGAWSTLRQLIEKEQETWTTIANLRATFQPLSQARTDILVANIVLPFSASVAVREKNQALASRAQHIYLAYPGLPSNAITRMMSAQLQLPAEPDQACLQQGLHDIYHQTCQTKDCLHCLCGEQRI